MKTSLTMAAITAAASTSSASAFAGPAAGQGATGQYLSDVMSKKRNPELASSTVFDEVVTTRPPLPRTNDPHILLGFNHLSPPMEFYHIRCAYKELAKAYHPDVVAGPDASAEERKFASWDFARINAAYDILDAANKRKEGKYDEEEEQEGFVYEVITGGGTGFDPQPHRSSEFNDRSRWDDDYDEGGVFRSKKTVRSGVSPDAPPEAHRFFAHNKIDFSRIKASTSRQKSDNKTKRWWDNDSDFRPKSNGSYGPSF